LGGSLLGIEKRADLVFLSVADILQDLMKTMKPEALLDISHMEKAALAPLHLSLGMVIRNHYNLWHEENPHTEIKNPVMEDGIITDPLFPDQMSQRLIERIWAVMQ